MVIQKTKTTVVECSPWVWLALLWAASPIGVLAQDGTPTPESADDQPVQQEPTSQPNTEPGSGLTINVTNDGMIEELNLEGVPLYTVLQSLLRHTKRNMIFGKDVQGEVTVHLFNVTLEEALYAVLTPNGYTYYQDGKFLSICTLEEHKQLQETQHPRVTRTYQLNYISPTDAKELLTPFLSGEGSEIVTGPQAGVGLGSGSGSGSSSSSGGTSSQGLAIEDIIIVKDFEENLATLEENLKEIDRRPKQVLVEATILRATLTESNAMGIDFNVLGGVDFEVIASSSDLTGGLFRNGPNVSITSGTGSTGGSTGSTGSTDSGALNGSSFNQLTNAVPLSKLDDLTFGSSTSFASTVPTGGLSLGIITDEISSFIRALEAVTDTTLIANPKVITLNKHVGDVLVGSRDGYLTSTTTETATTQEVAFLETGTQLRFRPFISNDGYVRMEVNPSDSTGGINSLGLPFEKTTEVNCNILVKDGHTVVIGGLFRDSANIGRSQIPGLGSIPIIGQAFGSTADSTLREEVIILLTVHIIDDHDQYAHGSESILDDIERLRVGIRESMQAHGRERLAQANYHSALDYWAEGDSKKALWHTNLALHNRPGFMEAMKLKEDLLQKRAWDEEGSVTREFVRNLILRDQGLLVPSGGRPVPSVVLPQTRPSSTTEPGTPVEHLEAEKKSSESKTDLPVGGSK